MPLNLFNDLVAMIFCRVRCTEKSNTGPVLEMLVNDIFLFSLCHTMFPGGNDPIIWFNFEKKLSTCIRSSFKNVFTSSFGSLALFSAVAFTVFRFFAGVGPHVDFGTSGKSVGGSSGIK